LITMPAFKTSVAFGIVVTTISSLLGLACSSTNADSSSDGASLCGTIACPADQPPSQHDTDVCKNGGPNNGKCRAKYYLYLQCLHDNRVCGPDRKTDVAKTREPCEAEGTSFHDCDNAPASG